MKNNKKFKQITLNYVTSLVKMPLVLLIGMVSTPLLLKWLGDERIAIIKMLEESIAYIGILEFGLSMALIPMLAKALGERESNNLKTNMGIGIRAYLYTIPITFIAALILYFFLPQFIILKNIGFSEVNWFYFFLILSFIFYPLKPFEFYLAAKHRTDYINVISFLRYLLVIALNLLFAFLGQGLFGQGLSFFLVSGVISIVYYYFGAKDFSWDIISLLKIKLQGHELKNTWQMRFESTILNFSNRISTYTDNLIIGVFISPTEVVPFFLTMKLVLIAQSFLSSIGSSVWAPLIDYFYKNEMELLNKKILEINKIISVAGMILIVPISLFNGEFISLWVGEKYYGGALLTYLGCIFIFFNALNSFWGWILLSSGNIRNQVFPSALGSVINIVISILVTIKFGIIGPIVGTLCSFLFLEPYYLVKLLRKVYQIPLAKLVTSFLPPLFLGVIVISLSIVIKHKIGLVFNWPLLLFSMFLVSLIQFIVSIVFLFNNEEKILWFKRIKGIF